MCAFERSEKGMEFFMDDYVFSSNLLYENLNILKQTYPFVQTGSAGKSIMGKNISYVKVGRGPKEVFYSASYHANEWITSIVLLEFLYEYCSAIQNNSTIFGFPAQRLFETVSIYVMPMVNPDGVDLIFTVIFTPDLVTLLIQLFHLSNHLYNLIY